MLWMDVMVRLTKELFSNKDRFVCHIAALLEWDYYIWFANMKVITTVALDIPQVNLLKIIIIL